MARGKATFKQSDATRAMKSAIAAGLEVTRVEIEPTGKIVMVTAKGEVRAAEADSWAGVTP